MVAETNLRRAVVGMARHPGSALLAAWNWKSAAISAVLRAGIFLAANRRGGHHQAVRAMVVEAAFAIVASGFLGAVTQQVRAARPVWATALLVWVGLPGMMSAAQFGVHRLSGTQHLRAGLIASFVFASVASGFTWFAMRSGVLLAGEQAGGAGEDARRLPAVVRDFLLWVPRLVLRARRRC